MLAVVRAFGVIIAALGILGLTRPASLIRFVSAAWQTRAGLYVAIALRLVLGIALIGVAPGSRFPNALVILGGVSIVAALVGSSLGFERLRAFVQWWATRPSWLIRAWGAVAVVFGVFLVYAVY